MSRSTTPLAIAVLISGGGTTLQNLVAKRDAGELNVDFRLVLSSNPTAGGLQYATDAAIPTAIIESDNYEDASSYGDAVFDQCRASAVELVVMAGFLKHVLIPDDFENRVINIHPSLIPAFCGKGFYGARVHEAVLDYGAKLSGCTVHFVDNKYDNGPIILQRSVPVLDNDTPQDLAARVFQQECEALPEAILLIADHRLKIHGRHVNRS